MATELFTYAIIGSRNFKNKQIVYKTLVSLMEIGRFFVVSGGARGVDTWVKEFCEEHDIPLTEILPTDKTNKLSYLFRNVEILAAADRLIAFWDGNSKGTKFTIEYAKKRKMDMVIIGDDGNETYFTY